MMLLSLFTHSTRCKKLDLVNSDGNIYWGTGMYQLSLDLFLLLINMIDLWLWKIDHVMNGGGGGLTFSTLWKCDIPVLPNLQE